MKARALYSSPCPVHVGTNVTELEDGGQHRQNGATEVGIEGREAVEPDQMGPPETLWLLLGARWKTLGGFAHTWLVFRMFLQLPSGERVGE